MEKCDKQRKCNSLGVAHLHLAHTIEQRCELRVVNGPSRDKLVWCQQRRRDSALVAPPTLVPILHLVAPSTCTMDAKELSACHAEIAMMMNTSSSATGASAKVASSAAPSRGHGVSRARLSRPRMIGREAAPGLGLPGASAVARSAG